MALEDIRGEQVVDFVADLIEPVMSIMEDEEAAAFFKREEVPEGMTPSEFFRKRVRASVPSLLKSHRKDVVTILAAFDGKDYEEYKRELTPVKLLADAFGLLKDESLLSFLDLPQTKGPEEQSGSLAASSGEEA